MQYEKVSKRGGRVEDPLEVVGDPRVHCGNTLAGAAAVAKAHNANLQKDDDDDNAGGHKCQPFETTSTCTKRWSYSVGKV